MITHLNEKLIAVEVPSDAIRYKISGLNYFCVYLLRPDKKDGSTYCQPWEKLDGNWKILGEVDADNISFDVEPYVKQNNVIGNIKDFTKYKHPDNLFRSLLQSKGIDTNKPNVKHVILEKV